MRVIFTQKFLRRLRSLPKSLQDEVVEKVEKLQHEKHHASLRSHKLHGALEGRWGFSVNYRVRIIFCYSSKKPKVACLLTVGNHSIYEEE